MMSQASPPRPTESHCTPGCSDSRGCPMRESCTGGRSRYRRSYFIERCHHERDSGYILAQQRGYSEGFCYVCAPCNIGRGHRVWGTASPCASVKSSTSVSEEVEDDDSPSPKLGGRAAQELRWLGETPVVRQWRTRGEQRQLDLDSVALFVEESACY